MGQVAAAVVAIAVLALPASASAGRDCGLRDTKRVLRTDRIVVTSLVLEYERPRVRRHYACRPGSARAYRLDDPSAEFDEFGELWDRAYMFRTNRGYLAVAREFGNAEGDYIKTEILVLNISTGRRRLDLVLDRLPDHRYTPFNFATDLVVSSRGTAAWIAVEGFRGEVPDHPWEVERARPRGQHPLRLDRGSEVKPHSLTLAAGGSRVAWRSGDARRSASLR
jgi:hypothetical protein